MRFSIQLFYMSIFFLSTVAPESAFARYRENSRNSCGTRVIFDCDHHRVTMGDLHGRLDCGNSTPSHATGTLHGTGRAAGKRWPCLRGKPVVFLEPALTKRRNILIHNTCGNKTVLGQNRMFSGSGCIVVDPKMLKAISKCSRAPYEIKFASHDATLYAWNHRGFTRTRLARRSTSTRVRTAYGYGNDNGAR